MSDTLHLTAIGTDFVDGEVAHSLMRESPHRIKVLDALGRILYTSENGMRAMEIDDFQSIHGLYWWDIWPSAVTDTLKTAVMAALRGFSTEFEAPCPTAKGQEKWWRVRVSRIDGGRLDGKVLASCEDITADLEAQTRNAELQVENHALRQFTRFVAHALRNPIRQVKLLTELVQTEVESIDLPPEPLQHLNQLRESANALMRLLAGLQDLQAAVRPEPVDRCSIDGIREDLMACLPIDGRDVLRIRWSGACDAQVPLSHGQLLLAMKNLAENAMKYGMTDGIAELEVYVQRTGRGVVIRVCDAGPGFPADTDESVFDIFRRMGNASGVVGSGTGLAIVRQIAARAGGSVRLWRDDDGVARGVILELKERNEQETGS